MPAELPARPMKPVNSETVALAAGVAAKVFIEFGFTVAQAQRMIACAYDVVQEKPKE